MPPRFAYWTILIDDKATAFRAREQADLAPTLRQLGRTNPHVSMKWFARGRLWESPEEERAARRKPRQSAVARTSAGERRGPDWRPGGAHRDPRDRFGRKRRRRPKA